MDSANKNVRLLDTFDLTMVLGPETGNRCPLAPEQLECLRNDPTLLWQTVPVALKGAENWWNEGYERVGDLEEKEEELFDWYKNLYAEVYGGSEAGREGKYLGIYHYRENIGFYTDHMRRTRIEFDCTEFEAQHFEAVPQFGTARWGNNRGMQNAVTIKGIKLRVYGDEYQQCGVVLEQLFNKVIFFAPIETPSNHALKDTQVKLSLVDATSVLQKNTWTEESIKYAPLAVELEKQRVSVEESKKRAEAGLYKGDITLEEYEAREKRAQKYAQEQKDRKQAILWGIVGFLIPIVGIVLFLVWRKSKPTSAKAALIGAGIGFVSMYLGNIK